MRASWCRNVPVRANWCQLVPVRAGSCQLVPDIESRNAFCGKRLANFSPKSGAIWTIFSLQPCLFYPNCPDCRQLVCCKSRQMSVANLPEIGQLVNRLIGKSVPILRSSGFSLRPTTHDLLPVRYSLFKNITVRHRSRQAGHASSHTPSILTFAFTFARADVNEKRM